MIRAIDELPSVLALERIQKNKNRQITPNTTQGDDGIGLSMHLCEHDKEESQEGNTN